jgi:hypothetical protein
LGHGELPGTWYLVTEWIAGGTLADRLVGRGVTAAEALDVTRRLAQILAPVHAAGVVHRDIKPSNVLLAGGELTDPRVIDFGLAWRPEMHRLTRTGAVIGTPGYMAPEQVRGDRGLDPRVDVFALGCLLYECLVGRPAFMGDGITAVQAKILLAQPPPIAEVVGDAPELSAALARLLGKDPARRPADAGAVVELLSPVKAPATPARARSGWAEARARLEADAATTPSGELFWIVLALVDDPQVVDERLGAAAAAHGADLELLADGSLIAAPAGGGSPAERAERAARLSLALRDRLPDAPIAVTAAAGPAAAPRVIEAAVERGARLLEEAALAAIAGPADIRVDARTAALLGPSFQLDRAGGVIKLRGRAPT